MKVFDKTFFTLSAFILIFIFFPAVSFSVSQDVTVIVRVPQCSDGADNDSDALTDYPLDSDCDSADDDDESAPPSSPPSETTPTTPVTGGGGIPGAIVPLLSQSQVPNVLISPAEVTFSGKGIAKGTLFVFQDGVKIAEVAIPNDLRFAAKITGIAPGYHLFSLQLTYSDSESPIIKNFPLNLQNGSVTSINDIDISSLGKALDSLKELLQESGRGQRSETISSVIIKPVPLSSSFGIIKNPLKEEPSSAPALPYEPKDAEGKKAALSINFSIFKSWYEKDVSPPPAIDMNKDGKVTLADLSILAHYLRKAK